MSKIIALLAAAVLLMASFVTGGTEKTVAANPGPVPVPAAEAPGLPADRAAQERLMAFFQWWSQNDVEKMLEICSPVWKNTVENPRTGLFLLLSNQVPLSVTLEQITEAAEDGSRWFTLTAQLDRKNGKPPVSSRLKLQMFPESGEWYLNPQSLRNMETLEP